MNYLSQPNIGGMTEKDAAFFVSFYWGAAMVGRFIGSAILQKLGTGPVLGFAAIAAGLLVTTSMLGFGSLAVWSIILVGLFNSVMFPSIFTLGIAGLGALTGEGLGVADCRHRGRRDHPGGAGRDGRQHRHSPRLHPSGAVLHVHRVLRIQGVEAGGAGAAA